MEDLAGRLKHRVQLTSDGHRPYLEAVEHAFQADIDYAMLVKVNASSGEPDKSASSGRYSPGEYVRSYKEVIRGRPTPKHLSTSFSERQT